MRLTFDQVRAPITPESVVIICNLVSLEHPTVLGQPALIKDSAAGCIPNVVFANKTAVPDTVAMASDIMNQAARKSRTSRSCLARTTVRPRFTHEYAKYPNQDLLRPSDPVTVSRGGPGLGRKHSPAGRVKMSHHSPTTKRARRSENVVEPVVTTMMIHIVCSVTAAR